MGLLNPIHGLVVPFVFVFTVPLAILAGITTTLAFSVLMFRVIIVYLDLVLAMLPQYIMGVSPARGLFTGPYDYATSSLMGSSASLAASTGSGHSSPITTHPPGATFFGVPAPSSSRPRTGSRGKRSRRPSSTSASVGTITPRSDGGGGTGAGGGAVPSSNSAPGLISIPSVGRLDRDFEGVGGWRLDTRGDDEDWVRINSRLELPLDRSGGGGGGGRHHARSLSGGPTPTTPGEGSWLMMKAPSPRKDWSPPDADRGREKAVVSPNSSRTRITPGVPVPMPLTAVDRDEGYFSLVSPKAAKKAAV